MTAETITPPIAQAEPSVTVPNRARGLLAVVVGCACGASGTLITKPLVDTLPVLPVVFLQVLASVTLTWALAIAVRRPPSPRQLISLGFPGVFHPGLAYMLIFAGLAMTPASVAGLLLGLETAFVLLLAWPMLGERASAQTLVAVMVGVAGVAMVTRAAPPSSAPTLLGIVLILGGVALGALDTVLSRRLALTADPMTMTAAMQLVGLAAVGLSAPFWPWVKIHLLASPAILARIFLSGILVNGIGVLLFNYGLGRISAGAAAVLFPLIAIFTAAGSVVFLGEHLSPLQLCGALLVIGSATAASRASGR